MTSSSKKFDLPKLPVIESCYSRYFGLTPGGVDLLAALAALPLDALKTLHDLLCDTTRAGGRVFIMGNGGSFDNSRFIADLFHRQGLICKTPGRPECYLQARTSDEYAAIFRRGLEEDRLCCNDLVIGLSGSGNSPNILEAFKYAQAQDAKIFALGGRTGGAMRKITGDQRALIVSSDNMEAIEDLHSACGVILAKMLERKESCTDVHAKFISALKRCLTPQTIQGMARLAHELLRTMRD
ncbi:MAG: SIS domain-containing protein, partial [Deltaproteobacteria bacterium]|nr:SIS domain-containing protein [Deltaproteobacteria bacterium]